MNRDKVKIHKQGELTVAQRNQALISVLERFAEEMTQQEDMIKDLLARHNELTKAVESAGLRLRGTQADAERSYDKLFETISHYRSDMLKLVNEQDYINKNIEDLEKVLKITTYSVDVTNKKFLELDERIARHEKASSEYYEQAAKQPGILRDALLETARDFTRLHANTEKHLAELHNNTEKQLNNFQHETMKRLLLLDGIVTSLQVLLARSDPATKKPLWIVRIFIRIRGFFRRLSMKISKKQTKSTDNRK